MQRVLIVGPCGAGKSTLARTLADRTGLPLHHMDQLNWRPGWVESSKAELEARLAEVVAGPRWIIDGTYGGTLPVRLARADTILYLDYPVRLCVTRLLRRIRTWRGRPRPDMPEGCPERFDLAFFWYALRWNAGPGPRLEARLADYGKKVRRFAGPAELATWLEQLPGSPDPASQSR